MILFEKARRIRALAVFAGNARTKSKRRGKIPRRRQFLTDGSRD